MAGAQHAEAIPQAPDAADDPHDDHARDAADEESEDALLTSARALVLARGKASEQLLGKNLHVSYERADALLGQLETEGIVGPKNGRGRREVLPAEQPGGSPPSGGAKPVTLLSQAKALVISRRRSSAAFLQGELGVTPPYAYKLLSLLEAEGVVGPVPSRGQQRQILVDGDGKPTGVPADIRICRKRGCREPVYIKKYGLCAKHASDHYHQQHLNRTEPTEGVKRLLPKAQAVIQKHGRATRALLQKELRVGRPRATEILMTLQHMGLVSPLSANNRRGVAAVSANTSPPKREKRHAKAITKREIHKVEQLIRTIGEESEMGRILRSLVEEARSSQSLRKHLRSVL